MQTQKTPFTKQNSLFFQDNVLKFNQIHTYNATVGNRNKLTDTTASECGRTLKCSKKTYTSRNLVGCKKKVGFSPPAPQLYIEYRYPQICTSTSSLTVRRCWRVHFEIRPSSPTLVLRLSACRRAEEGLLLEFSVTRILILGDSPLHVSKRRRRAFLKGVLSDI